MTWYDLRRICLVYVACEPALFRLCHPRRQAPSPNGQNYCRPWGQILADTVLSWDKPKDARKGLFGQIYKDVLEKNWSGRVVQRTLKEVSPHVRRSKYGEHRYKALNLHSYVFRGTLEFRHFHGSLDFEEISSWAKCLIALVQGAYAMSEAQARACYFSKEIQHVDPLEILVGIVSDTVRADERSDLVDWIYSQVAAMSTAR